MPNCSVKDKTNIASYDYWSCGDYNGLADLTSTQYVTITVDSTYSTNGTKSFKLVNSVAHSNVQFTLNNILTNTTYTVKIDIKTDKELAFSIIERTSGGSINSTVTVPANENWNTYTVSHTTGNNPTKINFLVNPKSSNATCYLDNIRITTQ